MSSLDASIFMRHVRELELHRLEVDDRLAELLSLLHVIQREVEARRTRAPRLMVALPQRSRSKASMSLRKPPAPTTTLSAGTVRRSKIDVGHGMPRKPIRCSGLPNVSPAVPRLDVDRADAFRARRIRHAAVHEIAAGVSAAAAPALLSVDRDAAVLDGCGRAQIGEGRPGFRLGHADGDDQLAGAYTRQHAPLERLAPETLDGEDRARSSTSNTGIATAEEIFANSSSTSSASRWDMPCPAVLLRQVDAEEAQLGVLGEPLRRHRFGALFELPRERTQVFGRELARGFLNLELIFGKGEVHMVCLFR